MRTGLYILPVMVMTMTSLAFADVGKLPAPPGQPVPKRGAIKKQPAKAKEAEQQLPRQMKCRQPVTREIVREKIIIVKEQCPEPAGVTNGIKTEAEKIWENGVRQMPGYRDKSLRMLRQITGKAREFWDTTRIKTRQFIEDNN